MPERSVSTMDVAPPAAPKGVRYVYALVRAFAADTSSGGRDRVVILGSDGSEVSWDGDRLRLCSAKQDEDDGDPWTRLGVDHCERATAEREAALTLDALRTATA